MIKVMLIDDEPEIRRLLHKMVEKQEGYQVVSECGNFAGAVADFARYRPDVVFVDIDLNGEDGLNCARVLTDLDPKLKVIFATAHSEYMANAFEIYAFDYLVKPFNMERLARTLDRIRSSMPEHARQGSMQNAVPGQAHAAGLRETRGNAQPTSYTPDNCDMQNKARSMAYTADGGNMPDATRSTTPAADSCTPQRGMQPGTNTPNPCIPQGKAGSPDKIARPDRYRGKLLIKGKEQTFLLDVEEILFIERMDGSTNIGHRPHAGNLRRRLISAQVKQIIPGPFDAGLALPLQPGPCVHILRRKPHIQHRPGPPLPAVFHKLLQRPPGILTDTEAVDMEIPLPLLMLKSDQDRKSVV